MNEMHQKNHKPHLAKEQRLPQCYKDVEKVLKKVKSCEANVKTVLYNSRLRGNAFRKVYALTYNVLKKIPLLDAVIQNIKLLEEEPYFRKELAWILIYELVFGKGLKGESKPVQTIQKYQVMIEKAYNLLITEGNIIDTFISIPKYVRINTLITTLPEVLEDLEYSGVKQILFEDTISEDEYYNLVKNLKKNTFLIDYHFKDLLVFNSEENLISWSLYQKGHVFIQDKSSYIPAHVLNPEPGATVIDACAAPGMKTLHLASVMKNEGTLFAFEMEKSRYEILKKMIQSGHVNICNASCEDFNSVDPNDEKYSLVEYILLDPSCSGSGMVSRLDFVTDTEDSKNDTRIKKLAGFQIILLKHSLLFPAVKRVVYSTCSISETENEFVVHEVLNQFNNRFKLVSVLPDWPIRGSDKYEFGSLCLRAYPDKTFTNGFFVAMFERIEHFEDRDKFLTEKKYRKHKHTNDFFNKNITYEKYNQKQQNLNSSILKKDYHDYKSSKQLKKSVKEENDNDGFLFDKDQTTNFKDETESTEFSFNSEPVSENIKTRKKMHKQKHNKQDNVYINEKDSGEKSVTKTKEQHISEDLMVTVNSYETVTEKHWYEQDDLEAVKKQKKHKRKGKSVFYQTEDIEIDTRDNKLKQTNNSDLGEQKLMSDIASEQSTSELEIQENNFKKRKQGNMLNNTNLMCSIESNNANCEKIKLNKKHKKKRKHSE